MASTASSEASEVRRRGRQRLIGAVALVLVLVVFVPMILDSEPRPAHQEPALAIPPKENAPPLPAPEPPRAAPSGASPGVASKAAPAPAPAQPPATPTPAAKPAAVAVVPRLEGFAVQIGAFRDDEKLRRARAKLAAAGLAHYTERLDTPSGALTRLRAGPFAQREAADAALAKLRRSSLDGKVVALP